MKLVYTGEAALQGLLIYAAGDTAAALVSGTFSLTRLLGIMLIGATVYAVEIPNYFAWIDRRVTTPAPGKRAAQRTLLAMAYFNPLWIARHLLFIHLVSLEFTAIDTDLLRLGAVSFAVNIPIALVANFVIQVKIPLRWRFAASATFSGLMAAYYALAAVFFG